MTAGKPVAASAAVLGLRAELRNGMRRIAMLNLGERSVEVMAGADSLWAIIRRGTDHSASVKSLGKISPRRA